MPLRAGAGQIGKQGKYSRCSFRTQGLNVSRDASSNPAVGIVAFLKKCLNPL